MKLQIKKGGLFSKEGLPIPQHWFCDGRLTFSYDELGIACLEYFIPTAKNGNRIMFKRGIFDSFRCSIVKDGLRYSPKYKNVVVYPYGLEADWEVGESVYKFGVYAVDGNVYFVLKGGEECDFRLTFFESTQFIPAFNGDLDSRDYGLNRTWKLWKEAKNALVGGLVEETIEEQKISDLSEVYAELFNSGIEKEHGLKIAVTSSKPCSFSVSQVNIRRECIVRHNGRSDFGIVFCGDNEALEDKISIYQAKCVSLLDGQKKRYEKVVKKCPKIKTPYTAIDAFCAVAASYHESTKADELGIIRAKTSRYWAWGWDSMVCNETTLSCWNDKELLKGMLDYFERTADLERGWAHWFRFDNSIKQYSVPASQGIYITLLENYIAFTDDLETLERHYAFAKTLFERLLTLESKVAGLLVSSSLVPDFPDCVHETGRDISLFNNSVAYVSFRAMETLALRMGDKETADKARRITSDTEKNFFDCFYDKEKGFFAFSVDADTLERRNCYSICGYFWDGDRHDELLGKDVSKCIDFIMEHGMSPLAFRNYTIWGDTYDRDANQLHATWGVVEEVILRTAKYTRRKEPVELWLKKLDYWMRKWTCPEGESYEFETDDPGYDRWNCEIGTWQTYTIRKWYAEVMGILLGISLDAGGLTFATPHCPYTVTGLQFKDRVFDIRTEGEGEHIEYVQVNGTKVYGTLKLSTEMLSEKKRNKIVVKIGKKQELLLTKAQGLVIRNYRFDGALSFEASGVGTLGLFADGATEISRDGETYTLEKTDVADVYAKAYFEPNVWYSFTVRKN